MVFAGTALWWLDHYATMHQYLRTQFRCVLEDEQLAIFELREGGKTIDSLSFGIVPAVLSPTA
jgi:hypothetical protein